MKAQKIFAFTLIFFWIILIICFYVLVQSLNLTLEESFFRVYNFLKTQWIYGAIIFIIIYVFRPLLFIIASPFAILCGFVYWFPIAFMVFLSAEICSVAFSYYFWKISWWKILSIWESFKRIQKIEKALRTNTFLYMLRLRLIWFPFDLLNYISWILKIPFKPYFFGTMLWVFPYNIAFLSAWVAFHWENIQSFSDVSSEVSPIYLLFALIIFIFTFVISRVMKRIHRL